MFFSLIQTLVCVLLIQTGLYALHLSGNSGGTNLGSNMNMGAGTANIPNNHMVHILSGNGQASHSQHHAKSNAGRLAEEIADFAQMERERLMLLDLAKQTAAAVNAASSTSHHGRPIITGRIQMTPAEEIDDVDYPGIMMQQPQRSYMFGSVVKQAPRQGDDYDSAEEFDGGGQFGDRRRPMKYEYGREVQTQDHELDDPQRINMDGFMELEVADPEVDEMIPDLDGYQYLDELLNEQHKNWNDEHLPIGYVHNRYPQNPYATLEELESKPPQALQKLFDKEREHVREQQQQKQLQQHERAQHDAPIVGAGLSIQTAKGHKELLPQTRNAATGNGYNIRLQQQWQRKRNYLQQQQQQQQQQRQHDPHLQRNIFGGHQKHHFNSLQNAKFSLANSETTATKHIGLGKNAVANGASSSSDVDEAIKTTPQQSNSNKASVNRKSTAAADASATSQWSPSLSSASSPSTSSSSSSFVSSPLQSPSSSAAAGTAAASTTHHNGEAGTMTAKEHSLQSNHKRSGSISSGSFGSGLQSPQLAHSIASQLMLRTARGQRQYDVPQIECPSAMDGMERFACPTPDLQGRYRCIDDHVLCDGFIDCPEGEDEDRRSCMFYKTTKAHLDVLADALLRWARGR